MVGCAILFTTVDVRLLSRVLLLPPSTTYLVCAARARAAYYRLWLPQRRGAVFRLDGTTTMRRRPTLPPRRRRFCRTPLAAHTHVFTTVCTVAVVAVTLILPSLSPSLWTRISPCAAETPD